MSAVRQELGALGERIAERWMRRSGWKVLFRRFRSGRRDVDLVLERDGVVAFVEVKTRRGEEFGGPVAAVGWRKQRELSRSAQVWVARHGREGEEYRFDVVGVLVKGDAVRVRHVQNAFALHRRG